MKITIDLPLLQLEDITFDVETLKYEDRRLELWNNLQKVSDSLTASSDIFFQTEMTINKELLEQSGLDIDNTTIKLAEILFDDIHRAEAVRQHFGTITYDEIEVGSESLNASATYVVGDSYYDVFNEKELLDYGREVSENYMKDSSVMELIGEIENLNDYFDVIDVKGLSSVFRKKMKNENLPFDQNNKDEEVIIWMSEHDEEYTLDNIENFLDYGKLAEQMIHDEESAAAQLHGLDGDHIFANDVELNGYGTKYFHIFERY